MTRTEQIQKNIEFLKSLQFWVKGIDDDMYGAYEISIMYLEKKIEDNEKKIFSVNDPHNVITSVSYKDKVIYKAKDPDDYIDMSGATDNGNR